MPPGVAQTNSNSNNQGSSLSPVKRIIQPLLEFIRSLCQGCEVFHFAGKPQHGGTKQPEKENVQGQGQEHFAICLSACTGKHMHTPTCIHAYRCTHTVKGVMRSGKPLNVFSFISPTQVIGNWLHFFSEICLQWSKKSNA